MAQVRQRRTLARRSDQDWEKMIKSCLHNSSHKVRWGCLNKSAVLFRICDFKRLQVPDHVVTRMEVDGRLTLKDDGFYKYTPIKRRPTKRKKLILFNPENKC